MSKASEIDFIDQINQNKMKMPKKGETRKIRQIRSSKQMNYFSPTDSRDNNLRRSIPMFSKEINRNNQIDEDEEAIEITSFGLNSS